MHHQFFGLFIDEWASLVAIGGSLGTAIALIMRAVLLPLKNSIDNLNQTIKALGDSTKDNAHRIDKLEDRFEEHLGEAKVRNNRIKNLEQEVFKKDR